MVSLLAEGLGIDDARDISQDAWARLWQQHQAGALESLAFPGIVITQARFLARDLLRRRRASPTEHSPGHDAEAPGASAEAALASAQALARVGRALAEVAESKREIFRLACEEGVPHAELARRVGLSTQRVKQIVWEVRVTLRAALEEPR
ncbi:MAG: sigma-70 family RNA polymerase sigma factor [Archangium sp.]|nr:sigma-70 family RNA polymerase sigma factor [Archangium sp.]